MFGKPYKCQVKERRFLTPNVVYVRFRAQRRIKFEPGQFLSLVVPTGQRSAVKRLYSFACSPEDAQKNGYELCVKFQTGGKGSEYLAKLKPGDIITVYGSYGEFTYRPNRQPSVCFISTGTGFGPIRSILSSKAFLDNRPEKVLSIFGARNEKEILFPNDLSGPHSAITISEPSSQWNGFTGRVTDYLKSMAETWDWHHCDFYVCGNAGMVRDVTELLKNQFGVSPSSIIVENFGAQTQTISKKAA